MPDWLKLISTTTSSIIHHILSSFCSNRHHSLSLMDKIVDLDNNEIDPCTRLSLIEDSDTDWPDPGKLQNNSMYGNYVVASRRIEEGELIIEEEPLSCTPYGTSDRFPFCLTCSKDLAFSERCSKCKWPICSNDVCEHDPIHSDECSIFSRLNIRPKGLLAYTAIEVLRWLLLSKKDPEKFQKIFNFEAHSESRKHSPTANAETEYVIQFVQEKCQLREFDRDLIDHVTGAFSVNTFWAYRDIQRFSSLLFDKTTMLAHDCDPNTEREIIERNVIKDGKLKRVISIQIIAARTIEEGQPITIYYTELSDPVKKRQKYLKNCFYFDCCCDRCLSELAEEMEIE